MSGWVIFLIILIVIAVISIGICILLHFRKKNIEDELNSAFGKKDKMLN